MLKSELSNTMSVIELVKFSRSFKHTLAMLYGAIFKLSVNDAFFDLEYIFRTRGVDVS